MLRSIAIAACWRTLRDFFQNDFFNFKAEDIHFFDADDECDQQNDDIRCSQLFPAEEGHAIVGAIFFRCEIAYYHCQLNAGKDYAWEQYLGELLEKRQMWDALVTAFQDALTRLDFKPAWESEELAALLDSCEQEE